VFETEFRE